MCLLDTDVLSAGTLDRPMRSAGLTNWMDSNSEELFLSTVTVTEICDGFAKLKRTGAAPRATTIGNWLEFTLHLYSDRILSFDIAAARLAGSLMDKARVVGHSPGFADIATAATAESQGLMVLTGNLRRFAPLGIAAIDPFWTLP